MSKSTKTTTENKPPAWAEPLFKQSADEAKRLYDSGAGGNTYLGSTVAPLSGTTMSGVNQLRKAGANWNTGGTRNLYAGIGAQSVNGPYVNRLTNLADTGFKTANNVAGTIATGRDKITTEADFRKILQGAQAPAAAQQYLTDTASGKFLEEGNPYYRARLEKELDDTSARVRSSMAGAGRYGSDVSHRVLAQEIGNQRNAALENDWTRERGLQMQAVGMLDDARMRALDQQMGAVTGISGVQGQNVSNRLAATGQMTDIANSRGNMLSTAADLRGKGLDRAITSTNAMRDMDQKNFENRLAGAEATLKAGGILDGQAQKLLADEVAKFYALDNQDWNRLSMLQGAATGAAGDYGVQNQTTRQPMSVGGLLSGIGSLFSGKSDIRAKENIVRVGEMNGLPVYEFSYRGERARWRGTMAQAVPLDRAAALFIDPSDGLYGVDYAVLDFPMTRVN